MATETPKRLGDYEILKVLGAGGMGRVYQVRNVITDRVEAMKVLLPEISGQEEVAARFLREIKVLAALNHPHIASLHTALSIENQLVMIMEYVEGQSISNLLAGGAIPVPDALTYIEQVLDALSYAHQRKVVHRDIKPANMMITPAGSVKLMDFGIARTESEPSLTAPGSTLGSMNYMSPEQVKGEATDERSDLYSLGISLYEMVIGDRPFHGDSSFSLMSAHLSQPPTPPIDLLPEMPAGLNDIILTSIAKEPTARFQSADAFRTAVQTVLRELQESKTMFQGSRDSSATGQRTPLPHVRTGPITRPRPTAPTQVPTASSVTPPRPAVPAATIPTASIAAAPAPAPQPVVPAPAVISQPSVITPAPAAARSGNRGLWVALGAVAVLIVLIAAGLYIPKFRKAAAADEARPVSEKPVETAKSTPPPAVTQPTTTAEQPQPTTTPETKTAEAAPAPRTAVKKPTAVQAAANNAAAAQAASAQAAAAEAAKQKQQELDAVEKDIDQLTARAASVNASLETLQKQQAAMGLGLRGDIAGKLGSMRVNLAKAQEAIGHGDLDRAKRYAALTTSDVEALETFLGR